MSLGDTIVVMDDGEIQQVGSPHEIYNDPVSQFVGEFIGSPAINMLTCRVERREGTIALVHESFSLDATDEQAERLGSVVGDEVTLGIRPEKLVLGEERLFGTEIALIEPQGSQDVVFLERGDEELRATVPQGQVTEKRSIDVTFSVEDVLLFDGDGQRLV
jgi:multiple sugar transport system ATP-binding protein